MNTYLGWSVPNRRVACAPFESLAIETTGHTFKVVKQKNSLLKLRVVIGNANFSPGTELYVRGDVITLPWSREVFEIEGLKFILVPEDAIQVMRQL